MMLLAWVLIFCALRRSHVKLREPPRKRFHDGRTLHLLLAVDCLHHTFTAPFRFAPLLNNSRSLPRQNHTVAPREAASWQQNAA